MKTNLLTALAIVATLASAARAASIDVVRHSQHTFSLTYQPWPPDYIDFDTFDLEIVPLHGNRLIPPVGDPNAITTPGEGGAGFNQLLPTPTFLGGVGLSFLGTETTSDRMFQSWSSLSGVIDLPPQTFLANLQFDGGSPPCAKVTMTKYRAGVVVYKVYDRYLGWCPEPGAAGLAALVMAAVVGRVRHCEGGML